MSGMTALGDIRQPQQIDSKASGHTSASAMVETRQCPPSGDQCEVRGLTEIDQGLGALCRKQERGR